MVETVLYYSKSQGYQAAMRKFALSPPTPADIFSAEVDSGKDMPPPQEAPDAPVLPQEPAAALGDPTGGMSTPSPETDPTAALAAKAAALGLKDMLFFEKMLGANEAKSMFQGIDRQMKGQGGGFKGTLNITPQGVQRVPYPQGQLGTQAAQAVGGIKPPPIPAAALQSRLR